MDTKEDRIESLSPELIKALEMMQSYASPEGLKIDLSFNKIDPKGAQAIAHALQSGNCPAGLDIDLSSNYIGPEGAQAIAHALQSGECPAGLNINLSFNFISLKGVQAIAHALQSGKCPAGLNINLSYNNIGPAGAQAIADVLQSGKCLEGLEINLRNNHIGPEGAQAIAHALQSGNCPAGLMIDLSDNKIGPAGAHALVLALESGNCPPEFNILIEEVPNISSLVEAHNFRNHFPLVCLSMAQAILTMAPQTPVPLFGLMCEYLIITNVSNEWITQTFNGVMSHIPSTAELKQTEAQIPGHLSLFSHDAPHPLLKLTRNLQYQFPGISKVECPANNCLNISFNTIEWAQLFTRRVTNPQCTPQRNDLVVTLVTPEQVAAFITQYGRMDVALLFPEEPSRGQCAVM